MLVLVRFKPRDRSAAPRARPHPRICDINSVHGGHERQQVPKRDYDAARRSPRLRRLVLAALLLPLRRSCCRLLGLSRWALLSRGTHWLEDDELRKPSRPATQRMASKQHCWPCCGTAGMSSLFYATVSGGLDSKLDMIRDRFYLVTTVQPAGF